jgi:hypothetical protein
MAGLVIRARRAGTAAAPVLPVDAAFVDSLDRILEPAAAREVDVARWQLRHWLHRASERIRAGPAREVHSRGDD